MKNKFYFLILFFASVLFFSCSKKRQAVVVPSPSFDIDEEVNEPAKADIKPTPKVPPRPYVMVSLQKNGCFGNCPEFEFIVLNNGLATFHVKKHTSMIGHYRANLYPGFLMELKSKVDKYQYFSFEKMYPADGKFINELPDTYTLVNLDGENRIIRNNHDAPKALLDFENYLADIIDKLDWKKIKD